MPNQAELPLTAAEFAALMAPLGPFGPAPRLAAGVSGGPDSLALALLASDWARARGGSLLALVADHGLRPDSGAEAEAVMALMAARGIPARLLRLGLPPGPGGLQDRARSARHAALLRACGEAGTPWLLLAHHRADQAETLLFRALRGSGPAGLAAMAPARVLPEALVLRPLLGVPPARLAAVPAQAGLSPLRDPSNADPRFARARLRTALADPGGTGPGVAALAEAAARFARRRERAGAALADRLAVAVLLRPEGFAEIDPLRLGGDALADAALAALLRAVGGGGRYAPPLDAVAALRRRGGGTLAGAWLRPGGDRGWRLQREPSAVAPPIPAAAGACWDGRFRLTGPGDPRCQVGALGVPPPDLPSRDLPASIVTTLPCIRRDGALVAVPALHYPDPATCARFAMLFAPTAGPVAG